MENTVEMNVELDLVSNIDDIQVMQNIDAALELGLPEMAEMQAHERHVAIVAGGPSINDTLPSIRALADNGCDVWAINGAHDWLLDRGVKPDAAWLIDGRPENVKFYRKPSDCTYYIGSRCAPEVFAALAESDVVVWHDANSGRFVPDDKLLVGGGTTMGVKALTAAWILGYRTIHAFGYDSCYKFTEHHGYRQEMNDGETVYDVTVDGVTYRASAWMLGQVKNFGMYAPQLAEQGCTIIVHGSGLLPHVARAMGRQ